ncbi:MAG: RidA family protein [Campylobacter sp.]|nr:RidA family protein [Campylobacter sp.]
MQIISTHSAPQAIGPYSQAIIANGFLFTSGQIALKPDGSFVDGDIKAQTEQVLANLKAVLAACDTEVKNVVKTTIFLANMDDFAVVNEIYGATFSEHKPARSCVAVKMLPKGALIEIELIAKVG